MGQEHLRLCLPRPQRFQFLSDFIVWGFPHRQDNANSYSTPSKVQSQASFSLSLYPLASLLPHWLSEQGLLVSILWTGSQIYEKAPF